MKIVFNGARGRIVLVVALSMMLGGCAGPKIAADVLGTVKPNDKPITSSGYEVTVTINPRINNEEGLDKSVKESLEIALAKAKIFTAGSATKYKIHADIMAASEAAMSFGSFDNTLQIRYTVADPSGREVLDKTISTEAGSDHWYFAGVERHQRARALNMAKNVLEFVQFLRTDGAASLRGGVRSKPGTL